MAADITRPLRDEAETSGAQAPAGPRAGSLVGRYVLLEELGRGGEGRVFAAFDTELERKVALKLLRDEASAKHARREARALAKLDHPAVVSIYDVGVADEQPYIAMELMAPEPFDTWAATAEPLEVLEALRLVATGIDAAHQAGLVHGDIKPSNILRSARGETKLSDFGVARAVGEQTGRLVGTRAFMAPELFDGAAAGPASDQYAFCVSAWQLFHGKHPSASAPSQASTEGVQSSPLEDVEVAERTGEQTRPMLRAPTWSASGLPRQARDALLRGLKPAPHDRWPSMHALELALRPAPRRSRWWTIALPAAVLSAGAAGVAFGVEAPDVCADADASIDELWPDPARARVSKALDAPGFVTLQERATTSLDLWADRWSTDVTASCRATHRERSQTEELLDLRGACYREVLAGFRATVDVLGDVDDGTRARAHEVLDGLPELDPCADVPALKSAPTLDAGTRDRVETVRGALARAETLRRAGREPEALALLETHTALVEALDVPRLRMEFLITRASALSTVNRNAEAAQAAEDALHLALKHDDNHRIDDALTFLTSLLGHEVSSLARADVFAKMLEARTDRDGIEPGDRGAALASLALHRVGSGDYAQAISMFERALETRAPQRDEDLEYAMILSALAMTQGYANQPDKAMHSYERVLEVRKRLVGETHPLIAHTLNGIAQELRHQHQYEEALELAQRAQQILLTSAPDDYGSLSSTANNRAQALARLGRMDEAKGAFEAAVEHRRRASPDGSRGLAILQMNLAKLYADEFDAFDEAKALGAEALRLHIDMVGAQHVELVMARAHYGQLLGRAGETDEARTQLRTAIALGTETLGREHPDTLYAMLALGALELDAQAWAEATRWASPAVAALREDASAPAGMLAAAEALLDDAKAQRPRTKQR